MKNRLIIILLLFSLQGIAQNTTLKPGDQAPDFKAKDQNGKDISLSDYQGKKVVLYFYPQDNTTGCTQEACNLRDNIDTLATLGYTVIGVSTDDVESHKGFSDKYALPFPLVADTDKSINQRYGVWVEKERDGKKFMGTARTTFIIDEKGVIVKIITKVDTANHTQQLLTK